MRKFLLPFANVAPVTLVQLTFAKWYADNIPRHAAALAYYTMFAVAPLLLIVAAIAGTFYGREAAEGQIAEQVGQYINNPSAAELIQSMLVNLNQSSSNLIITIASVVALFYGASNVFGELQITLNHIWRAPNKPANGLWGVVLPRLLAVGMVLISGILLFLSLVLTTWIAAANSWAELRFARRFALFDEGSYFLLLLGLTTVIFALIYRYVPDVRKPWHEVLIGAIATALLFSIARFLLGWYLSYTSVASTYGAAGSLVLLLLWVYYSAQIFFLGAEFTQVYGQLYNTPPATEAASATLPAVPPQTQITPRETPAVEITEINQADDPATSPPLPDDVANAEPTLQDAVAAHAPQSRWGHVRAAGRSLKSAARVPLRITRPLGEIALAAGVIGVASVAALLWSPLRRRASEEEE